MRRGRRVSESILGGLGSAFVTAAEQVSSDGAHGAGRHDRGRHLPRRGCTRNVAVMAAVTLPAVVGLFVLQVTDLGAAPRARRPGPRGHRGREGVARGGVRGGGDAVRAAGHRSGVRRSIAAASGLTVRDAAARFVAPDVAGRAVRRARCCRSSSVGALIVGFLLLWGVLLFRKAALILVDRVRAGRVRGSGVGPDPGVDAALDRDRRRRWCCPRSSSSWCSWSGRARSPAPAPTPGTGSAPASETLGVAVGPARRAAAAVRSRCSRRG